MSDPLDETIDANRGYGNRHYAETLVIIRERLQALEAARPLNAADYEEVLAGHRRLVRQLDVALNGADAAKQASLCDIVAQVEALARLNGPVLERFR